MKQQTKLLGLWGDQAKDVKLGTFSQLESEHVHQYNQLTVANIEEALEGLTRESEREMVLHTGPEGRRLFNEVVERWITTEPTIYGTGGEVLEGEEDLYNWNVTAPVEREGQIRDRDINYIRLQNGEITPVEYLDLISDE